MENLDNQRQGLDESSLNSQSPAGAAPPIDQLKLENYLQKLRLEQNMPMGFLFGIAAMLAGALLWAVVTITIKYQIGYMAIGVGILVGFAVRKGGQGIDKEFAFMGAALSFLGCILGNYFSTIGFIAASNEMGYLELLNNIPLSAIPEILADTFSPIDLLFYGLALHQGYRLSLRLITEAELVQHAGATQKPA